MAKNDIEKHGDSMPPNNEEKTSPQESYWAGRVDASLEALTKSIENLSKRMDNFMDDNADREKETNQWRTKIERKIGIANGNGDKDRYIQWPWILENVVVPIIRTSITLIVAYIFVKAFGIVV